MQTFHSRQFWRAVCYASSFAKTLQAEHSGSEISNVHGLGHSNTEIAVSNPTRSMDVCSSFLLLWCLFSMGHALRMASPSYTYFPTESKLKLILNCNTREWLIRECRRTEAMKRTVTATNVLCSSRSPRPTETLFYTKLSHHNSHFPPKEKPVYGFLLWRFPCVCFTVCSVFISYTTFHLKWEVSQGESLGTNTVRGVKHFTPAARRTVGPITYSYCSPDRTCREQATTRVRQTVSPSCSNFIPILFNNAIKTQWLE
jgi:hypothetical protein